MTYLPEWNCAIVPIGEAAGKDRVAGPAQRLGSIQRPDGKAVLGEQVMLHPVPVNILLPPGHVAPRQEGEAADPVVAIDLVIVELFTDQPVVLEPELPDLAGAGPSVAIDCGEVVDAGAMIGAAPDAPRSPLAHPARLEDDDLQPEPAEVARQLEAEDARSDHDRIGREIALEHRIVRSGQVQPVGLAEACEAGGGIAHHAAPLAASAWTSVTISATCRLSARPDDQRGDGGSGEQLAQGMTGQRSPAGPCLGLERRVSRARIPSSSGRNHCGFSARREPTGTPSPYLPVSRPPCSTW